MVDSNTDPEHPGPGHPTEFDDFLRGLSQGLLLSSVEPNEDDHRRAFPPYELWRELDIPFEDHLFVVENKIAGAQIDPGWAGWFISYLGLRVDVTEEEANTQYEWPRQILGASDGRYFGCIQVRIMRVTHVQNPLTAERRWTPYGRYRDSVIIDSRRAYKPREFTEISRGFDLLNQFEPKKRRGPAPLYSPAALVEAVHALYAKADKQGWNLEDSVRFPAEWIGSQLTPRDLAERTLNDYLRAEGWDLNDLRHRRI